MATKEELQKRVVELEADQAKAEMLFQISRKLTMAGNKDELLQVLAQPAIEAGAFEVYLMYIDLNEAGAPEWVETAALWRRSDSEGEGFPVGSRFYLPEFPFSRLWISSRDIQLIADLATDDRVDDNLRKMLGQVGTRALGIIPLVDMGRWTGLLSASWDKPYEFSEQELEFYQILSSMASPTVESRRLVDMVEERTAELHAAEIKSTQIVERALVGMFRSTPDGQVVEANPALFNLMGYNSLEEVNEIGLSNLYVDSSRRQEFLKALQQEGEVRGFEVDIRHKGGSHVPVAISALLVMDEKRKPAFLEGTIEDISVRKQAEEERERLQQEVIDAQQRAIAELSTPVIPIMDRVIVMPMVGSIDSLRARDITRALLAGIGQHRAKVVILDVTGVSVMDTGIVNHLNKTIQAAQLKGAQTIVTGISDAVAETIVDLGIDWSNITTLSDLRTGLVTALDSMGIKLSQ